MKVETHLQNQLRSNGNLERYVLHLGEHKCDQVKTLPSALACLFLGQDLDCVVLFT